MWFEGTDMMGREVAITNKPSRIISLVPSQTELLVDLGLRSQLVGITRYCIHPKDLISQIKVVGGTKKIVKSRIETLKPDFIICNKEENTEAIVNYCETIAPVYVSDISNLNDALKMIADLGLIFRVDTSKLIAEIYDGFAKFEVAYPKKNVAYLIWKNPYMTVGKDTFIHDLLSRSGFENIFKDKSRYPQTSVDEILNKKVDIIFLASEPYSFKDSDIDELVNTIKDYIHISELPMEVPEIRIVDGEMFSWYGSRLLKSITYLKTLRSLS